MWVLLTVEDVRSPKAEWLVLWVVHVIQFGTCQVSPPWPFTTVSFNSGCGEVLHLSPVLSCCHQTICLIKIVIKIMITLILQNVLSKHNKHPRFKKFKDFIPPSQTCMTWFSCKPGWLQLILYCTITQSIFWLL